MTLEVYIASLNDKDKYGKNISLDGDVELVPVLEDDQELAVKISDVFDSISSLISESISNEAELVIELTGSTSFKAEGSAKYMIINLGGSATKESLMKISLKTKIDPKR
jgi:hypothetical protein